jgi:hypothetical protein
MDIKVKISIDGCNFGTLKISRLECGSGIHTYSFRPALFIKSILNFEDLKKEIISSIQFVCSEILEKTSEE